MTREKLLSPYLDTPVWQQLIEAIDQLLANENIDDAKRQLRNLRSPINTQSAAFTVSLEGNKLTRLEDVESLERDSIIQHANLIGFNFKTSNLLQVQDYLRISLYVAQYYAETKGTVAWQDFLGFVLNAQFTVTPMWTQNYVDFFEEGDPAIGYSVYEGGFWYPTTHVVLAYDPSKFSLSPQTVYEFFYYFANINLVLEYIFLEFTGSMSLQVAVTGYLDVQV